MYPSDTDTTFTFSQLDEPMEKLDVDVDVHEIQYSETSEPAIQRQKPKSIPKEVIATPVVAKMTAPDRLLLRLDRLFAPTKDIGSVLTTANYTLYLLAYLDNKAKPYRNAAVSLLRPQKGIEFTTAVVDNTTQFIQAGFNPANHGFVPTESSRLTRLGHVIYDTRATLRLVGLLPTIVKIRRLMNSPKGMDTLLKTISVAQCSFYAMFQFLENVAFLTEKGVLSRRLTAHARTSSLYKLAHRAWFMAIVVDMMRLVREAQLFFVKSHEKDGLSEEDTVKAAKRYFDWIRPLAWLPIGWKLSDWTENGNTEMHLGLQGVLGVLADLKKTARLWDQTQIVSIS